MAFLHVYIRMDLSVQRCHYHYQQLVPQGRNIHPGTWHSSAYMVNGSYTVQRRDYYQQLVPQRKWDMAFLHVYIRMDLHGAALRLPPAACATREKYTPRDMAFLHVYTRMGSTWCRH
jgi:hypothetical protein